MHAVDEALEGKRLSLNCVDKAKAPRNAELTPINVDKKRVLRGRPLV